MLQHLVLAQMAAASLLPKLLPLTGLAAAALFSWRRWQQSQRFKPLLDLPGPKRHWLLGNVPQILAAVKQKTYFKLLFDWSQEYGSVFCCWAGGPILVLSRPQAIEQTIVTGMRDGSLVRSQRSVHAWNDISGPILLGQSGEEWQWRRKAWNPEFSVAGLAAYGEMVRGACSQATATVRAAGPDEIVQADPLFVELTMRVIGCLLLGIPVEREATTPEGPPLDVKQVYDAMAVISYRFLRMATGEKGWKKYLPTQNSKDYWAARQYLESVLAPRVDLALQLRDGLEVSEGQVSELFRHCMLVKIAAKEQRYGKADLIAEAIELLIAGTDTTAHTLSYAMGELALHPEVMAKARAAVDGAVASHGEIYLDSLKALNYVRAVVQETLRLYSVASGSTSLEAVKEMEVEGITIPPGTKVFWSMVAAGRDGETYGSPEAFKPERWLEQGPGKSKGSLALPVVQFGSGFHRCLGEHLAMLEATVMLAQLLREFDWELVNGRASLENLKQNLLIYPEDGMPLRFRARMPRSS